MGKISKFTSKNRIYMKRAFIKLIFFAAMMLPTGAMAQVADSLINVCYKDLEGEDTTAFNLTYPLLYDAYVKENDQVIVQRERTGQEGRLTFGNLTHGVYEIQEVTPPPGYIQTEERKGIGYSRTLIDDSDNIETEDGTEDTSEPTGDSESIEAENTVEDDSQSGNETELLPSSENNSAYYEEMTAKLEAVKEQYPETAALLLENAEASFMIPRDIPLAEAEGNSTIEVCAFIDANPKSN